MKNEKVYLGFFDNGPREFSTRERAEFYSPQRLIGRGRKARLMHVLESQTTKERYLQLKAHEDREDREQDRLFEDWLALAWDSERTVRQGLESLFRGAKAN